MTGPTPLLPAPERAARSAGVSVGQSAQGAPVATNLAGLESFPWGKPSAVVNAPAWHYVEVAPGYPVQITIKTGATARSIVTRNIAVTACLFGTRRSAIVQIDPAMLADDQSRPLHRSLRRPPGVVPYQQETRDLVFAVADRLEDWQDDMA